MKVTTAAAQTATAISPDQGTGAKLLNLRIVHTAPEEIRDSGRVKIGDGGTAPVRHPLRKNKSTVWA